MRNWTVKFGMYYMLFVFGLASCLGQSLKIMTYNIRLDVDSDSVNSWNNRKTFLVSQIQFFEPDIFGVQEAKPNQVNDITTSLNSYGKVGIGREGVDKGEASCIYFKKSRFDVVQEKTFWLSQTPDNVSIGWDAACHRICTYALFKDKLTNHTFWVFNTHLDHIGEEARTKGIELILSTIKSLNSNNYTVFFMGDFNLTPDDATIKNLSSFMMDSREVSELKPFGPIGTFNGFKHNERVTNRIDYIFLNKENKCRVLKYAVLSDSIDLRYPSDHFPVLIELVFD